MRRDKQDRLFTYAGFCVCPLLSLQSPTSVEAAITERLPPPRSAVSIDCLRVGILFCLPFCARKEGFNSIQEAMSRALENVQLAGRTRNINEARPCSRMKCRRHTKGPCQDANAF